MVIRKESPNAVLPKSNGYLPCFTLFSLDSGQIDPCSGRFVATGISLALEPWTIGILYPASYVIEHGLIVPPQIIEGGSLRQHPTPFIEISVWLHNPNRVPVPIHSHQPIAQLVMVHCARPLMLEEGT